MQEMEELWHDAIAQDIVPAPQTDAEGGKSAVMDLGLAFAPLIAGIATGVTAVIVAIGTVLWFITVISWPLLIGGLVVGAALSIFGGARASKLGDTISKRFSKAFIPKIKKALIEDGYSHKGEKFPSTLQQLITKLEETADAVIRQVDHAEAA
ncbi:MAG: hypothetical protein KAI47_01885 [Deltaproteobacteria bacterium]|nr:hypothetical protein [Deltaproteobacteria bacterium]